MAHLTILNYSTPHQETLSENGCVPTTTHYVVKNSSFLLEIGVNGEFYLRPQNVRARLLHEGRQGTVPEEPLFYYCRSGKDSTVVLDIKLNVLSSQFSNGLFHIAIDAVTDSGETLQVCPFSYPFSPPR
jgi:hypothetical protein